MFIRPFLPDGHRTFFAGLRIIFLGLLDAEGRPWALPLCGPPGFVSAPDDRHLAINASQAPAWKDRLSLNVGAKIGLLGLDFETRRRNRANGTIVGTQGSEVIVEVGQSFGNCPKYIRKRTFDWSGQDRPAGTPRRAATGDPPVRDMIHAADTFFIASRSGILSDDPRHGLDVSHRGGDPGFLSVGEGGVLSFPDYSGNRFFNTLGNIRSDGRTGLLIPGFPTGDCILVTGRAFIDWSATRAAQYDGAERIIDVVPDEVLFAPGNMPAQERAA